MRHVRFNHPHNIHHILQRELVVLTDGSHLFSGGESTAVRAVVLETTLDRRALVGERHRHRACSRDRYFLIANPQSPLAGLDGERDRSRRSG